MPFNEVQKNSLGAPLWSGAVKKNPRGYDYVEGWHAIAEANRIFGFDGWTRETVEIKCVSERPREIGQQKAPGFGVSYICRVRIEAGGVTREGAGAGHGIDRDLGLAHESAIKEAETDAMKRALMTFGNPFGLALYDKERAGVADESDASRNQFIGECGLMIADFTDVAALITWWNSDAEKQKRRDFDLSADDVEKLKAAVTAKREALIKKAA